MISKSTDEKSLSQIIGSYKSEAIILKKIKAKAKEPRFYADDRDNGPRDMTPLMWASAFGYAKVVKLLIDLGANVNAQDGQGRTALMVTASGKSPNTKKIVKILIKNGASGFMKDEFGNTAWDIAYTRNSPALEALTSQQGMAK